MLTQDQLEQLGVDVSAPAPAPAASANPDGALAYGVDQAQRMAGRGVQALGGAARQAGLNRLGGWVEDAGKAIVEQQDRDIAAGGFQPQYPGGFLDQPGVGAKLGWLGEGIASNAASSVPALAGAAGAAVLAPTAPALAAGALALGRGTSFLLNAGESAQEFDDKGVSNDAAALGAGAVKTGLDLWGAGLAAKPFKAVGAKLAGSAAAGAAGKSAAREVLGATAGEGFAEGLQDTTDKAAAGMLGASYTPGEVAGGFLDSALIGGVLGGGTAAAGRVAARLTPESAQPEPAPAMPDGVEPMSKEALDAARARMDADTARSEEARAMREGSAAAQENALVPYNEAGPWRRFSEAAGPGQTTDQGFRGGMLPGPAPDFIEGEFSDVTGQPQAPGFGGPGFEQQIRPQAAGAAGMIGEWPAGPAPVAPSAPTDLLALPAPSLDASRAAGPVPDYYMPPAIGPLTTAVRAAVSQQQAGAPTSIAGLLPAPVAAPVATAPAATTAAPALPQMPYPRPALPAFAGSTAPSIPAATPAPQPQPQEASHVQGQRQAETEALLSGEKGAGAAQAAAPVPIKTERAAQAAARRKSKATGQPHEAVAVDGGWRVQLEQARSEPPVAPPKPRKPVRIDERKDTMLTAIAKAGGLSREEAAAHGIDPADFRRPSGVFGRPIFRKSGGMSFDGMAELLHQYGYPVTDERGNYSPNVLLDAIDRELRGTSVRTPSGIEAQAERDAAEQAQSAADSYGMTDDPFEFSDAELDASGYADLDASTQRVAEIVAAAKARIGDDAVESIAERVAIQSDSNGLSDEEFIQALENAFRDYEANAAKREAAGNPGRADAGRDAQGEGFRLDGYSESDIARREAEAVAAREREEKARKAAEDRARAERDRGQFELTGSDRPADANPRQSDLLDLTGRPERKPAAAQKPEPAAEAPRKSDVAKPAPAADQPVEPAAGSVKAASEKPDETDKIARQPRVRAENPPQGAAPEGATNDTAGTTGSSEGDSQVDDGHRAGAGKAAAGRAAGARRGAGRADDRSVSGAGVGASDATAAAGSDGAARKGAGAKVRGGADLARGDGRVSADFRPEPGGLTRSGSWLETASRNLDLIDLARKIESEGRNATAQEQAQLALYVGFGAGEIRNRMFPVPGEYLRRNNPNRLIFPEAVEAGRWRSLAERAAALPEDWQRSILQVTQYQHFTSENVIRSIWSALQRIGFTGGKVFEPGTGIGSFRMLMPESVASTSKFTGIEFDGPTALIARLLSPEQNMLHGDFIKQRMPDDYFDVVIGNPPFSQTQVLADPRYQKHGFMLHDFFFAKSLDKLRPGGVLAFVTSKGTMDKKSDRARRYLADRADLLGAVRLPSTAFEGNAGTSVVTDVIFLRKRAPGDAEGGLPWRDVRTVETKDGPVIINEYFADNPGMVLGQNRISGNTDDEGRRINSNGMGGEKYTVVSYDKTPAELDARFARAVESLPEAVYRPHGQDAQSLRTETAKADFDPAVKREGVVYVKDGELMRVKDGVGVPLSGLLPKLSAKDTAWLKDYSGVRDLVREAQHAQITDGEWQDALKRLNAAYDDFVSKHGRFTAFRLITRKSTDEDGNVIEKQSRVYINRRLMIEDYDSPIVTQLESIDDDGAISKGPFLKGRSINAPKPRDVRTIGDALAVSLDEIGRLDLDDIARRLRISRDDAIDALGDQVFRTPQGEMQMADEYLSGNVVEKLAEAIEAARLDDSLRRNVEALEKAQPERLGPSQIGVKLGASWVPAEHVNEFASMIGAGYVTFDPKTESWAVEGGNKRSDRKVGAEYGTAARSPSELLEALLNSRSIKVMKTVPSDTGKGTKNVVDAEATTAANEMAGKIKSAFKSWVWTDSERAAALVETYNDRFNNIAGRRFDGSHLTLPGVSLRFKMHAHQLRAIWRQIVAGNTYLAHAVGAGKTIEMIAGAMEQKRIGLIRKPMFVVPNHMLEQFANEFMELYPLANIMVADDKNFSAERRKEFTAAAALNNPDAIVITQSAFERVGVKEESIKPIRDEILGDLEDELDRTAKDNDSRVRRSQLEQQIEATKQRFDSILSVGQKDNVIPFEDLGVDMLYVDEAHAYRKLDFHTTQQIKGIDPNGSRRALDMYVKTRVLDRARPGRSFVFASGTPVTNTMGELYTVMRFFAPDTLDRDGTATFDSWARAYGDVVPALEQNASGKYEVVDRFARFENVPELMARVRQFMDVLQSEHLGAVVERPDIEGGKPQLIIVEPTAALKQYQEGPLSTRLAKSRAWKPSFNEPNNPDPVLAIITDGRFAATDPRFIPGGEVRPGETTKMDRAADEIIAEYRATSGNVYVDRDGKPMPVKGGTQIVFYNVGFGAAAGKKRGFDARAAFTRRLVASGIARDQIAWFDDADTDAKKEAIFKAMRAGTLRVLIGSAKKMGTGVNVQNRLTALHYMDPPWYPSDVEQPHGRIIRQRNQNKVVRIKWYATKGGYDATMWQMVGRKQRFIDQAFSGDKTLRGMDDLGESSQYEQAAALASGDPRALQLAGLRQDVERLERLHSAHANEQIKAKSALAEAERGEKHAASRIEIYRQMLKVIGGEHFTFKGGSVGRQSFDRYGEFGDAVKVAFNNLVREEASSPTQDEHQLATVGNGLKIIAIHDWQPGNDKEVGVRRLMPTGWFDVSVDVAGRSLSVGRYRGMGEDVDGTGLTRRIVNVINSVDADLRAAESERQSRKEDVARLRKKVGAPFEHYAEMLDKHAALKELEEELRNEGAAAAQQAAAEVQPDGDTPDPGPETRFSRGAAVATPGTRGMPVSQVRRLANNLARTLGINPASIIVHETLPEFLAGAGRVKGATDTSTGQVHLVASNLTGVDDALATLRHELIGHRGLRGVLRGEAWHNVMRATLAARGKDAAITRAMDAALREEFGAKAGAEQATFDGLDAAGRDLLAEETIARAAEADVRTPVWQRIVGAILRGLRAVGLWRGAMNDTEMRALLRAAQRGLRRQGQGRAERDGGADGLRYRRTVFDATREAVVDAVRSPRTFNLLNRTVGTQFHKAWKSPQFRPVYDAVQDFLSDAQAFAYRASGKAPTLLPRLDGLRDVVQHLMPRTPDGRRVSRADTQAAATALFDGRIEDKLFSDADLRKRGLTDVQISLYREARAAVDASLDDVAAAVMGRIAGDHVGEHVLSRMKADPAQAHAIVSRALAEIAAAEQKARDAALAEQKAAGDAAYDDAIDEALAAGKSAARAEVLAEKARDKAESAVDIPKLKATAAADLVKAEWDRIRSLKEKGYAPLMRFGDYFVRVTDKDARGREKVLARVHFETRREANIAERELRATYPDADVQLGVLAKEDSSMFDGLTPETLELFGDAIGLPAGPRSQAFQEYLQTAVANRSALKRMIHARKIAGYSADAERVLASFIISNGRYAARQYNLPRANEAWANIPEHMGDVRDEAAGLIQYVNNPRDEAAGVRSLLFAHFLGGSVASAITNMTQPVMMTLPYLSSIVGPVKAAQLLTRAVAITAGGVDRIADPGLRAAMQRAVADGVVAPQEIHQLYAEAIRNGLTDNRVVGRWLRSAATAWGAMFSVSEQINRRLTFAAGYMAAKGRGDSDAQAAAFAERAVQETQGVYNKGNRPNWARGAVGATVFTFRQYSIAYMEFLSRLPARERLMALGILTLAAGIQGLPGADDLDDGLDTLMQALGYDWHTREAKERFLSRWLPQGLADFVQYGASSTGVPFDFQSRLGLGNLVPGTELFKRSSTDRTRDVLEITGPAGSVVQQWMRAWDAFANTALAEGAVVSGGVKALKEMAPVAIGNALKAADMAGGYALDYRGRRVAPTTTGDAVSKAIGFQPASLAQQGRDARIAQERIALAKEERATVSDLFARSRVEKDPELAMRARQRMADWNRRNPESRITVDAAQIRQRVKAMLETRDERLIRSAPRTMRKDIAEQISG